MTLPDPVAYQQLNNGDPFGPFDCTAWSAAWVADAQQGHKVTTGTQVRAKSNEPKPDPKSPGLNLPQVADSVRHITSGKIDLDVRTGYSTALAKAKIIDGRWAIVQVNRGYLVDHDAGGANGFRGGHAITVHYRDGAPYIGDPLVKHYTRTFWNVIWLAASHLVIDPSGDTPGSGRGNFAFTLDLSHDYKVSIQPKGDRARRAFYVFTMSDDGKHIVSHELVSTGGFTADCTPPRWYPWPNHTGRSLVQLTTGSRAGKWVNSKWSDRV